MNSTSTASPQPGAANAAANGAAKVRKGPFQPVPVPAAVKFSVALMGLGALVYLVSGILQIIAIPGQLGPVLHSEGFRNVLAQSQGMEWVPAYLFYIVQTLVAVGLWLVIAKTHQDGHGWARQAGGILAVAAIVLYLVGLSGFSEASGADKVVSVIAVVISVVAAVSMWNAPTTRYIEQVKANKQA